MCIIICKPSGVELDAEVLRICWQNHPDGAGFAWVDSGKLVIRKGFMRWKAFIHQWHKELADHNLSDKPVLLHFRTATSGKTDSNNTHPYLLPQGYALAHNGMLAGLSDTTRSDTRVFVEDIVNHWPVGFVDDKAYDALLTLIARESGSKIAILTIDGRLITWGSAGEEDKGVWYSNSTYKQSYNMGSNYMMQYGWEDDAYDMGGYHQHRLAGTRNYCTGGTWVNGKRTSGLCEICFDEPSRVTIHDVSYCLSCFDGMYGDEPEEKLDKGMVAMVKWTKEQLAKDEIKQTGDYCADRVCSTCEYGTTCTRDRNKLRKHMESLATCEWGSSQCKSCQKHCPNSYPYAECKPCRKIGAYTCALAHEDGTCLGLIAANDEVENDNDGAEATATPIDSGIKGVSEPITGYFPMLYGC